jgi:cobalamin biosynthetic protein CobC
MTQKRDHGGGLDAAVAQFGGSRAQWLDLSTGINPTPYPIPEIPAQYWQCLPDAGAQNTLLNAARKFWNLPNSADIIATSGVSQLIAMIPSLSETGAVEIIGPTYNEHAAAFNAAGWNVGETGNVRVVVHPNNPDGRTHNITAGDTAKTKLTIIDESFCDVLPQESLIALTAQPNVIVLKGLGKFWGLAGMRLGFAIASPELCQKITDRIGPWAISGPAQYIGAAALNDQTWAKKTRARLASDTARLDTMMSEHGYTALGGTDLFRLYDTPNAVALQTKLAQKYVWSRAFPYSNSWLRLGLPGSAAQWDQLKQALEDK